MGLSSHDTGLKKELQIKPRRKMNLLEKIDELRANSVTPERFERVWGISIEEHLDQVMSFIKEQKTATK